MFEIVGQNARDIGVKKVADLASTSLKEIDKERLADDMSVVVGKLASL